MVVGIEKKRERVATATQDVVDDALAIDTSGIEKATAALLKMQPPDMLSLLYGQGSNSKETVQEGDVNINIEKVEIHNDQDVEDVADRLGREIQREKRMRGQTS